MSCKNRLLRLPATLAAAGTAVVLGAFGASATAQPTFSIDYQGPTKGGPDFFFGVPITEGDILTPGIGPGFGPLPPPGIAISGGFGPPAPGLLLPLHAGAIGLPAGIPGFVELDALSYGMDWWLDPNVPPMPGMWHFSVDEWATGFGGTPLPPSVFTEGAVGPAFEASADTFIDLGLPPGPLPPFAGPPGNTGFYDGDGLLSATGFVYPGLGLIEPNFPTPGPFDQGDNLDALDVDDFAGFDAPVFFSLDSHFFDPLEGMPNTGSAVANGPFVGGDVLMSFVGTAGPFVYAPAPALGLDIVPGAGPDSDDLDALILWENGDGIYTPSVEPYDWFFGGTDMLLFSVRRGSALIGAPDSIFGIPIEEGDILTTPLIGGASPFPGIFIAAENLGLATVRSGTAMGPFGDDLDALDVIIPAPGTLLLVGAGGLIASRRRR